MLQLDPAILTNLLDRFIQASEKHGDLYHGAICTDDPGLQQLLKSGDIDEAARFWREALELAEVEGDEAGRIVFVGVGLGEVKPIEIGKAEWLGRMFNPGIVDMGDEQLSTVSIWTSTRWPMNCGRITTHKGIKRRPLATFAQIRPETKQAPQP
jgi:hypothetical protein